MRIIDKKENINYVDTKDFFDRRAHKYKENNPYSVTMYQDNNSDLVNKRNLIETKKLMSLLSLNSDCKVLDLACGIGRWSDAIGNNMKSYVGIDFSEELIKIASSRNKNAKSTFLVGPATNLNDVLESSLSFNRVLLIGILMYLNDEDLIKTLNSVEKYCEDECRICIREPLGLENRLTLKDFYSQELEDSYNAIYRTREEVLTYIDSTLLKKGFYIEKEGFLFNEGELNNRKETAQYYFILKRGK